MTRSEIIDLVDVLTERKGRNLRLPLIYQRWLQDISQRYRFWWRKRYASFYVLPGTNTYSLKDLTTAASPGGNGLTPSVAFTDVGVEEVVSFFRPDVTTNPPGIIELNPVLSGDGFVSMLFNTNAGPPGRYVFDYSDWQTIRFDPVDVPYQVVMTFWGMPNPATDSASDVVPMLPPWYHTVLVDGMRYDVFANSYGEENSKTLLAKKDYEDGINDMIVRPQFTSQAQASLVSSEHAVRSTERIDNELLLDNLTRNT